MPRLVPSGTPSRTDKYIYPRRKFVLFGVSLAAGISVAILLTIAVFHGAKTVASPGPLSSSHAPFEQTCAACHAPKIADVRCEYCHDRFWTNRYQNAGHVWFGTKDTGLIAKAASVDCEQCHGDHRGRHFPMARVDDRKCQGCHFSSMAKHPEFALVKAKVMKDEGLHFSHKAHLKAMKKANLEECQYCHELTSDRRSFQPPSFDQHCAKCHLAGGFVGATDPIDASAVVLPQQIEAPWARFRGKVEPDRRGDVIVRNLAHKDPWILFNLWRIAREVDPEGMAAKRAAIERKVAELSAALKEPPTKGLSLAALKQQEQRLAGDVATLSRDPGRSAERRKGERALERVRVQIELGPLQPSALRPRGRSQILAELRQLRADLANFEIAAGENLSLSPAQREQRLAAVAAMTSPCTLCHVYSGALMAPLRAAVPVLNRANFTHLPHLQQLGCQACHTGIAESRKAEDVNLPGVASCQNCHRPGKSRADCTECHIYHPPSEPWPPI